MKTAIVALPIVPLAPVAASVIAAAHADPVHAPASLPKQLPKSLTQAPVADLLTVMRGFDGDMEAQFNTAHDALTQAYLDHAGYNRAGALSAMLESKGMRKHEKAMRKAIQVTGIGAFIKQGKMAKSEWQAQVDAAVAGFVASALTIYSELALVKKEAAPKAPKKAPVSDVKAAQVAAVAAHNAAAKGDAPTNYGDVMDYARSLDTVELSDMVDSLMRMLEARHAAMPLLEAA